MNRQDPTQGEWPAGGLERVEACPVCASPERSLLFDGLKDRIFFCAPGEWTMFRCRQCRSAYLDPRPTPATIGIAYREYYTHHETRSESVPELSAVHKLRRVLANGYRNWRFGSDLQPSSKAGVATAIAVPGLRRLLDRQHRHLPANRKGRVLDIGFGNGDFLRDAAAIGWKAVGTDIDPKVIQAARDNGLDVACGTVDEVDGPFDYITLCHTIEHFHDPCHVLRRCHELLAPGGTIWIETPNADACGLRRFGRDWRGLEPPRHLVLFNPHSLRSALERAGFTGVRGFAQPSVVNGLYGMSENIRRRQPPLPLTKLPARMRAEIAAVTLFERLRPETHEFLGMMAIKA